MKKLNYKKIWILILFFVILFNGINMAWAADTCAQVHEGYGQCAPDCTALGSDYQQDSTTGLCSSGSCCFKTGGQAATTTDLLKNLQLQVPLFEVANINNLPEYIGTLYRYLVIILVPLAIVMIIVGGVFWIMAAGDQGKITSAKKYIISAFSGLIIGLFSYVLLSLVGINTLTMPSIEYISPLSGDQLMIIDASGNGTTTTVSGGGGGSLPPGRQGSASEFQNKPCPKGQKEFDVFFTYYYKPKYGFAGGALTVNGHTYNFPNYGTFECNIGMQCACPLNPPGSHCDHHGNLCVPFGPNVEYCNHTSANKPPVGGYTIAADDHCFKLGCKIMIEGKGPYEIHDTGSRSRIIGLHMDYFVDTQAGTGLPPPQGVYHVSVVDPGSCYQ